ncbi:MAG: SsrA-binding protein SmpB [Candidatus Omnitrophica bacterium]|nr:SsrA-binding protein SmpB [Candidatus Omnitrophota bacterium]
MEAKTIAVNKKAYHNFVLTHKWECGIVLTGGEVKSVRAGEVNFADSFARIEEKEVFLHNLHINPYRQASYMNDEPDRIRKLLLHRKEIEKINGYVSTKGMTLIPTKVYFNSRGILKVELALGRGKKLFDKREDIKKRTIDRALKRISRSYKKN